MATNPPSGYPIHPIIDLPEYRLFNSDQIPPRCISIGQKWCTFWGWTALHESGKEMIMFSDEYLSFDDPEKQGNSPSSFDLEFTTPHEGAAKMYDRVTSSEPRTHPNFQQYYGTTEEGLHRYEVVIGPLFLAADKLVNKLDVKIPNFLFYHWAWQLASALKFLHDKTITYSTLEPDKLWIRDDFSLVLCDLSYACHPGDFEKPSFGSDRPAFYAEIGSFVFPDDVDYEKFQPQSDFWGYGTILYYLMKGKDPFDGKNDFSPEVDTETWLQQDFPLKQIVRKCWLLEYTSIDEVLCDVEEQTRLDGFTFNTAGESSEDIDLRQLLKSLSVS